MNRFSEKDEGTSKNLQAFNSDVTNSGGGKAKLFKVTLKESRVSHSLA